jgi:hypothetical protein
VARKAKVKERDEMKKWMNAWLERHPDDYWLRLQDGMYGNFRPADGILFSMRTVRTALGELRYNECLPVLMIEFKVERRKKFAIVREDIPEHQMSAMEEFASGPFREWAILVYHAEKDQWHAASSSSMMLNHLTQEDKVEKFDLVSKRG